MTFFCETSSLNKGFQTRVSIIWVLIQNKKFRDNFDKIEKRQNHQVYYC
jgi:hypothetical protein